MPARLMSGVWLPRNLETKELIKRREKYAFTRELISVPQKELPFGQLPQAKLPGQAFIKLLAIHWGLGMRRRCPHFMLISMA